MNDIREKLHNPSKEYRCVPFWAWNDRLEAEELCFQIREMKEKGAGGFFMHARGGLETPYMQEEWMNCVRLCAKEAAECDMEAWLYDEDGWPSGFAGGEVTALGDAYHTRWIEAGRMKLSQAEKLPNLLGIYDLEYHPVKRNEKVVPDDGQLVYAVWHRSNPYYVDVLNPAVIKKFLELTHERYAREFPDWFRNVIPGFFTDEPQYAKMEIPWSYLLPEEFYREHGYPVTEVLPSLFFETDQALRHRYDFWKTVSRLFTNGFMKTIYEWCHSHHCKLTGHLMREDSILLQMHATAGVMMSYEYMDMPGIDWLRRRISSPLTPKQVGSVAAQLGKKQVISEMFAMVGWDCSFEELKWIAQWQYVNGVNRMCQHLDAYSIRGIRKRDYPASLFYQQSWWEEYRGFNDYFARLGVILTWGQEETDVLLLHPMRSGWVLYDGKKEGPIVSFGQKFENLSQCLSDWHIAHHYGDEGLIEKYGRVEGALLKIGYASYSVVAIPDMVTIEASTLRLLFEFQRQGGLIVGLGSLPSVVCGGTQEELRQLKKVTRLMTVEELKEYLNLSCTVPFPVSYTENGREVCRLHYQMRRQGEERILYLVNLDQNSRANGQLCLRGSQELSVYDPLEDTQQVLETKEKNGFTFVQLPIEAMDSRVVFIKKREREEPIMHDCGRKEILQQGGAFDLLDIDWNAMTLDTCQYRIEDGEWQGPVNTIRLMDILLMEKRPVRVSLKFSFTMEISPQEVGEIYLVCETPGTLHVHINGMAADINECGWWKDKGFRRFPVWEYLHRGYNEIVLDIDFWQSQKVYDVLFGKDVLETERNKLTFDTEIESIYLIGKFGVYNRNGFTYSWRRSLSCDDSFVIGRLPEKLYGDDFTSQGFCFFAGMMKLRQKLILPEYDDSRGVKIEKIDDVSWIYRFRKMNAPYAKLYVNGHLVRKVLWAPYECDITKWLRAGENEIVWELYASNRNLLGPHHHIDGELYAVFPADFTDKPSPFKEDPRNEVWTQRYHFVKFGL